MEPQYRSLLPVLLVYILAIFLSAALLFLVQPMAAKLVLPILGGSPSVWNTTMVFFQALLLLGYLYSHVVTRKLPRLAQGLVHAGVILAGGLLLPIALPRTLGSPGPGDSPAWWLLMLLPLVAGGPFFVLTTTGPLLQSWFAGSGHRRSKDPYFLYAASNIGSFAGLLSFPFLLEPRLDLSEQSAWFSRGYCVFAGLVGACFVLAWRRGGNAAPTPLEPLPAHTIDWPRRLIWIVLAAVPSSLTLGATQAITTDISPVPLLWIVPLSLYLLTFVLAFSDRMTVSSRTAGTLLVVATLGVIATRLNRTDLGIEIAVLSHLAMLFFGALTCHRRLAESRPPASGLTEFYLWLAVGGVLGGAFNAFLAPVIFNASLEYPIATAAACCLIPSRRGGMSRLTVFVSILVALGAVAATVVGVQALGVRVGISPATLADVRLVAVALVCLLLLLGPPGGAVRFGVGAMVAFVAALLLTRHNSGDLIYVERTFFGIHEVYQRGDVVILQHGTTTHGAQSRRDDSRHIPVTYYHPAGPLGDIIRRTHSAQTPAAIAAIGLGTGTLAAYPRPGDTLTFFEIDPAVVRIAENPNLFTFLADSEGTIDTVLGDGRVALTRDPRHFDLIVLDAFSSDAVPMHLLTREAMAGYRERLRDGGALAFHVSSRFLAMSQIIAATLASTNAAHEADPMVLIGRDDALTREESSLTGRYPSTWLLALRRSDAGAMLTDSRWILIKPPTTMKPWTDSYSSIWSAIAPAIAQDAGP